MLAVQRSNRFDGGVESSPFNFVTYTPARLIVSPVEGRLDARCVFVRTGVEMLQERDFYDFP